MRMAGTFRAAVFGMNDGLVSNLALLLGVAAAGVSGSTILITGLSGLLAGALSMGAGEYVSVRSQRELLEASTRLPPRLRRYRSWIWKVTSSPSSSAPAVWNLTRPKSGPARW